jgi:beta-mannanase
MRFSWVAVVVGAAVTSLLLMIAGVGSHAALAAPPQSSGIYFGYSPKDWPSAADINQFAADAGKNPAIVNIYEDWEDTEPPASVLAAIHASGSTPMLTWQPKNYGPWTTPPYPLAKIAAGAYDAQIRRFASAVKNLGYPVFLRPAHEMNGDTYPWIVGTFGQTAADYVNAWRHLHDVFASAGATNVIWVWSPDVYTEDNTSFSALYPGDAYVDWVGLDGYNWGGNNWQSFASVFGSAYQSVTAITSKPLVIAEIASAEANDGGAKKAAWLSDALTVAIPAMPQIRALCWFNVGGSPDWRIESSSAVQAVFAAAISSPRYLSHYAQ